MAQCKGRRGGRGAGPVSLSKISGKRAELEEWGDHPVLTIQNCWAGLCIQVEVTKGCGHGGDILVRSGPYPSPVELLEVEGLQHWQEEL